MVCVCVGEVQQRAVCLGSIWCLCEGSCMWWIGGVVW